MPSREPKILVQTAAHIAGAAYYYRPKLENGNSTMNNKRMIGVCIHPKYGGWFAIRGVIVFKNVFASSLERVKPLDVINAEDINNLVYKFNVDWRDWSYRDIIPVSNKYSELQKQYFALNPSERPKLLSEVLGLTLESGQLPITTQFG
jgi:cyanocobalamin reductase (cyanide-eliminating) / alkylcobalamin dealkylase